MPATKITPGTFTNGIPYVRFGDGPQTMLFFAGGPGNTVPSGFGASGFVRGMRAFTDEYTIILVTRKSGLPEGYTTKDMADDYAELIRAELGGHVDLVMGTSYGGLIAQYFAAKYPELFDRLVIVMSGRRRQGQGNRSALRRAHQPAQGPRGHGGPLRSRIHRRRGPALYVRHPLAVRGVAPRQVDETFRRDVVIEARAEADHDSRDILERITSPTLVVGSTDDFAFPVSTVEEMAHRIPGAQLKLYPGGHTAAFLDKRFHPDVLEFTRSSTRDAARSKGAPLPS